MYLIQIKSYTLITYLLIFTKQSTNIFIYQLIQHLKTQTKKYILNISTPTSLTKNKKIK